MTRLRTVMFAAVALAVFSGGCSKPTRDDPIRAHDDTTFQTWLDEHGRVLTPAEIKELTEARQMIRFRTMQSRPGMASADFARAVYSEIDGKRIPELLKTSYSLQIDRVRVELENYPPLVEKLKEFRDNHRLSEDEKADVAAKLADLDEKIRQHREELERLTQRLNALKQDAQKTP